MEGSATVPDTGASDEVFSGASMSVQPNPTAALALEMTEVLKQLRLKGLGIQVVQTRDEPRFGLVDSGATTALRFGSKDEIGRSQRVRVQLAVGEADLWLSPEGVLLCDVPVQPIIPIACLPQLGCEVSWTDKGITIRHPSKGWLPVTLRGACPELPIKLALQLLQEFESVQATRNRQRAQRLQWWQELPGQAPFHEPSQAVSWLSRQIATEGCTASVQLQLLRGLFPELPQDIATAVVCEPEYV